ncbi:hypothetical protein BOX15_Mlig031892g1 [Macrostomum lignano]|uniref:Uncharacterized protein n=1 Tax=Macrostomum lignano TaxID=282301 RepID=A0A267H2Z3_9PLAT|nr:hypothetical protein BOX15_Mlig031892g1 [Macrostomum lignano]
MYREYRYREAYLAPINDKTLQMIGDSRVRAACTQTGCLFFVQNRMCSRKICGRVLRCCIFEVRGVSRSVIGSFNKILEGYFPEYKQRKVHDAKGVKARISFNEWTPDNTKLFYMCQRFGLGRGALADVVLDGPCGGLLEDWQTYHTGLMDMIADVPRSAWMAGKRESEGLYTSSFGNCINYQPTLFRRACKNKTYRGRKDFQQTTERLPNMNYFSDPEYMDRLIDPLRVETLRQKEALLEAERHSHKTMMPGYSTDDKLAAADKNKSAETGGTN